MNNFEVGDLIICDKWGLVVAIVDIRPNKKEYKAIVLDPGTNSSLKKGDVKFFDVYLPWKMIKL